MNNIWLSDTHLTGEEEKNLQDAIGDNQISFFGKYLDQFEDLLSEYFEGRNVVALNSGTSAIHLSLVLLGIGQGDYVICSSMTYAASAFPVLYQRANPVFIDSEPDTWNIDTNLLEEAIKKLETENSKPKAIIPVHLYGMPAKMDEIVKISHKYNIPIIEDAAESLGSRYKDQMTGSFGDLSVLSFNGNKIITTSGGGALLSNNSEYINKAKFLATQARDQAVHYQHSEIGYNYRMGNINAAIGVGQIQVLEKRVERRRQIFNYYKSRLSSIGDFRFQEEPAGHFSNRWLTCIVTDSYDQREKIRLALEAENIEARPFWKPMHLQPVFKDYQYFGNGVSDELFEKGLCLPSGSSLTDEDLGRIVDIVVKEAGSRK